MDLNNNYITYRENYAGELQYFLLQKEWPHYVGMILDNPNYNSLYLFMIPNTKLYIAFFGTIQGRFIPSTNQVEKEIALIFVDMAEWYYKNRIESQPKKYKKWLLKSEQIIS